ncbi:MAG: hypothetical protein JW910_05640 [Anaerolineae bacterium]|nr:hypothetical protein [Anaerolineae bacterium]
MSQDPHAEQLQRIRELARRDQRDEALVQLYALVQTAPDLRDAWWLIAQLTPHTPRRQEALDRVLALDPEHKGARTMAERMALLNAPTRRSQGGESGPRAGAPSSGAPTATGRPAPKTAQVQRPRPADTQIGARPPAPQPLPPQVVVEREVVYRERTRRGLQPFLVFNGGCMSGCFATIVTAVVSLVLAFLLFREAISEGLRLVNALGAGESVPLTLAPAVVITGALAFLQSNPAAIPFVSGAVAALFNVPGSAPAEIYGNALGTFWQNMGYPPTSGSAIIGQLNAAGSQLNTLPLVALGVFLGGWIVLAFLFVFLRARSNRLLHWLLSTVGLWVLVGFACGLGSWLFGVVFAP